MRGRRLAQRAQEYGIAGDHPCRPLQRLDDHGGQLVRVLLDEACGLGGVVVLADDPGEGRVQGRDAVSEEQDAAVVGAGEDEHAGPPRDGTGERQREQVRFRARVAEAHELDRREARADRLGEHGFVPVRGSEHEPVGKRASDRVHDDGM